MNTNPPNWPQYAAIVYQACTGYDQYLPKLNVDVARSWGSVFEDYELTLEQLLAGVHKLYRERGSGFRVLPGDIAAAARAVREDRLDRAPLSELEDHYQRVIDRVAPRVIELPEAAPIRPVPIKYQRPATNPLLVSCPFCHAPIGRLCTAGNVQMRSGGRFHPSRIEAAETSTGKVAVKVVSR